jgi:hypothetical protein
MPAKLTGVIRPGEGKGLFRLSSIGHSSIGNTLEMVRSATPPAVPDGYARDGLLGMLCSAAGPATAVIFTNPVSPSEVHA